MCTYLKEVELKTATHDIKVYKLVKWEDGKLFAPYRNVEYPSTTLHTELGKVVTNPYWPKERVVPHSSYIMQTGSYSCMCKYSINIGLHSFKNKLHAKEALKNKPWESHARWLVIKAVIPKGSQYYEGFSDYHVGGYLIKPVYVSDNLILYPKEIVAQM